MKNISLTEKISSEKFKKEILNDYEIIVKSREASLLGRKEVLSGKAKFGIFGDGKELPQIALAKVFESQGNYSMAISTYEQLILIFPEKKIFFADQIKKIKIKII